MFTFFYERELTAYNGLIYYFTYGTNRVLCWLLNEFLEKKRIQYVHIQWLKEIFLMELALVVLIRLITRLSASPLIFSLPRHVWMLQIAKDIIKLFTRMNPKNFARNPL